MFALGRKRKRRGGTEAPAPTTARTSAERHRQRMAAKSRIQSMAVADIGELPQVVDPARREAGRMDLHFFLRTYFPQSTGLKPFSPAQIRAILRIQTCVLESGRFAQAFPRGFAKTSITEGAAIWAVLYGHRKFVPIFGADADAAAGNIDSIKMELAENDLLHADFPEVCHAIRALEGKSQRCASQTWHGELTHIEWRADTIVLPCVAGSVAGGAIITAIGYTAAARGMKHKRPDGTQQRPDFILVDDPQTDESAGSPAQVQKRLGILKKSILKLGGHGRPIACVVNGTIIEPGDMMDQLLDPKRNPAWQSERIPMVLAWAGGYPATGAAPTNWEGPKTHETMWLGEYARIRNSFDAGNPAAQKDARAAATEYYRAHRAEMDAGASVTWEHCFDPDSELSAIQHAYNALIDDGPEVFASECQNVPKPPEDQVGELKTDGVLAKAVRLPRGIVPAWATHLTAYIDVGDNLLSWGVLAIADGCRSHLVDYGTWPEQPRKYFAYVEARNTLGRAYPGAGKEAAIRAGLLELTDRICTRAWKREGAGGEAGDLRVGICPIDASDGDHADIVYEVCRQSPHAAVLRAAKGQSITAASLPWEMYKKREGEQLGHHWRIAPLPKRPSTRLLLIDANWWKTFTLARILTKTGDPGSLELFGTGDPREDVATHQMLADHCTAEYGVATEGRGRKVTEWRNRPGRDNHFWDVLVNCFVGASVLGIKDAWTNAATPAKRKVKLSEVRRQRYG